jgi:hypothetical protein
MLMFVFRLWKNRKFDVVWYVYGTGSQPTLNTFVGLYCRFGAEPAISCHPYGSSQPYTPARRYL